MIDVLLNAAAHQPTVRDALDKYLGERRDVYTDPTAFQRFIDGGGNVAVYREVAEALRATYAPAWPRRLVDIGCGDGRLTAAVGPGVEHIDLVEPSGELLQMAMVRLEGTGPEVTGWQVVAERFVEEVEGAEGGGPGRWDVAQSTFALHALEPAARRRVLAALATMAGRLVMVEFDVPTFDDRSPEHAAYAVDCYRAGIAEYDDDLVVQGFLMPVLVGQFDPDQPRHTWEQPVDAWAADLHAAGFATVHHRQVHPYWWAPAHLIVATA